MNQDVSMVQSLGDKINNFGLVTLELGQRCWCVVNRDSAIGQLLLVGFGFLEIVGNPSLDVGLFGRRAIQDVGDLPSIHEFVVVLGVYLSSQIDGMPYPRAFERASTIVIDVKGGHQAHNCKQSNRDKHSQHATVLNCNTFSCFLWHTILFSVI